MLTDPKFPDEGPIWTLIRVAGVLLSTVATQPVQGQLGGSRIADFKVFTQQGNGVIDLATASQRLLVSSVQTCSALCARLLVCSAFSTEKVFNRPLNAGGFEHYQCTLSMGDYSWTPDGNATLYIVDMEPLDGYSSSTDGRYYKLWCKVHGQYHRDPMYRKSPVNGKFYKLHLEKVKWSEAAAECAKEGATLANVYSDADQNATEPYRIMTIALAAIAHRNGFWVGGTDKKTENTWVLPDGTEFVLNMSGDPLQKRLWQSGEPNGGTSSNCITMSYQGICDYPCDSPTLLRRFLCEIQLP